MRRSWIFVPRPRVSSSRPVAIGSSVPQWPTFLIWSLRLTSATTSCDVMPAALSTSRTPSGVAVNDIANCFQNTRFDFGERAANACPGSQLVPTTTELLTNRSDIRRLALRSHADTNLLLEELLKENCYDHTLDRAQVIDQSFVVL